MTLLDLTYNQNLNLQLANKLDYIFKLSLSDHLKNHIHSFHAAAIFSLAEASSAQFLINTFKEFEHNVIPLLRTTNTKYKRPAQNDIYAKAYLKNTNKEDVLLNLESKKKVLITIAIEIVDEDSNTVFIGDFDWFLVMK